MEPQVFSMSQSDHPSRGQDARELSGKSGAYWVGIKTPLPAKILSPWEAEGSGELRPSPAGATATSSGASSSSPHCPGSLQLPRPRPSSDRKRAAGNGDEGARVWV